MVALVPAVVALALARPVEVLEEWEMVSITPPRESVTARGVYRRAEGPDAVLPAAVQGDARPTAFAPGVVRDLAVAWGRSGWQVMMPTGPGETIRIVARVERPAGRPHLFRLAWPTFTPARVPTRRVVQVDRSWLSMVPPDWSCAVDDFSEIVPCVSTERSPSPLVWRVPAPPARRVQSILGLVAMLAAAMLAIWSGGPERRRERAVGALGGAIVGASIALAAVGALVCGWLPALLTAGVGYTLLGVLATRRAMSSSAAGIALLLLPLLVVADGRWVHVVIAGAAGAIVVAVMALVPERKPGVAKSELAG